MTASPTLAATVFALDPVSPTARLVYLTLAVLAYPSGHVETTVDELHRLTALDVDQIELALGYNLVDRALFPARFVHVDAQGVVTVDLHPGA